MANKTNLQHLKLINRLKKVEKYKNDCIIITIATWSYMTGKSKTIIVLYSEKCYGEIFKGSTMSELERFINNERKEAGLFQEKIKGGK